MLPEIRIKITGAKYSCAHGSYQFYNMTIWKRVITDQIFIIYTNEKNGLRL